MSIRTVIRLIAIWGMLMSAIACSGGSESGGSGPDGTYTLCDCVIRPPTTDAKLAACNALIEATDPGLLATQTLECKKQIPVPDGGPDACFCLTAESEDPAVFQACEALLEDVSETEMFSLMRR